MIRRLLATLFHVCLTEDEEIEHAMARLRKEEREPSLFTRLVDHPIGFCILFFGGLFAALGFAEVLCILLGAPFDPRLG
jgi:hypothetical protein